MKCAQPFVRGVAEFGCGKCPPCLMNRRRLWTARLVLEAHKHKDSCFVTLTYNQKHLPANGHLVYKKYSGGEDHMQEFLKALRHRLYPVKIRFFGVGEYGDVNKRPHYHLALFGTKDAEAIKASWPYGFVHIGSLTPDSAAYVVSYVVKGYTKKGAPGLGDLPPEFARMSLKPGIGADAMPDFARSILNPDTGELILIDNDVPSSFKFDGRNYPLGRYLRRKLRRALHLPEPQPDSTGEIRSYKRMVDLREYLRQAGKRGHAKLVEKREQGCLIAKKRLEIIHSRKGML